MSQDEEKTSDALIAVIVLLRQDNEYLKSLISIISQKIKYRSEKCLEKFLEKATDILELHQQYLDKNDIDGMNTGLEYLSEELKFNDEEDTENNHKKLICRIFSIQLLLALRKYYVTNNIEIPKYMNEWEKLCLDKDEFSEIRNVWKDNE